MFGSETLEVAIGIIFVFILASILCTTIREGLEAWLKTRAVYLEHGIRELLHVKQGGDLATAFYTHPLIFSLFSGEYKPKSSPRWPLLLTRGANLPSYIPSKNFALALMDIAARGPEAGATGSDSSASVLSLEAIRANVSKLRNPAVQRALLTAVDAAQGDIIRVQATIEAWYDSTMDRVSGWYKRSTQGLIFAIGLAVAIGFNINTITVADYLYHNGSARAAIVARAGAASSDQTYLTHSYTQVKDDLEAMHLPIGWAEGWGAPKPGDTGAWNNVFAPIFGWLLTALAASLGAPFWFDTLNKVMVIRSTVKPHEKSPEEASEDRQLPAGRMNGAIAAGAGITTAGAAGTGATRATIPPPESIPPSTDSEGNLDGCDVDMNEPTPDEALPEAKGGVA